MTTNNTTITRNITIDESATEIYVEKVLEKWVKLIGEEATIVNDHGGLRPIVKIDGIVLLADGNVCPTFHNSSRCWSLNKLYKGRDGKVHLSTLAVAGVMNRYRSLDESVCRYNYSYYACKDKDFFDMYADKLIIAYYEF